MSAEQVDVGHKKWWGPRIWRILHSLAEISDRIDCGPAWRIVLANTADMLPCPACRAHFHGHIRTIPLSVGRMPRDALRHIFWLAHAGTGGALPEENLSAEYGCGGDRTEVLRAATSLVEEVFTGLRDAGVYDRFTSGHLIDWNRSMQALITLLQVPLPAMPPAPAPPSRIVRSMSHPTRHGGLPIRSARRTDIRRRM